MDEGNVATVQSPPRLALLSLRAGRGTDLPDNPNTFSLSRAEDLLNDWLGGLKV